MGKEPEVITFKEFFEKNKSIPFEELCKIVLVCKNCQHKDLLKNFIREVKKGWDIIQPQEPSPYKPYKPIKPYPPYKPYTKWKSYSKNVMSLMVGNKDYEDMFFCPKCGSSLVVLCKEFIKNNILRGLNEQSG